MLAREKLPARLVTDKIWQERFEDINAYERYLSRNGVVVLKFFLNLSKKEQQKRFLERLDDPEKNWKFSENDVLERRHWDEYMSAYEEMIRNTSTKCAPGTSCRPTTNGSRAWPWPKSSSMCSRGWISPSRRWIQTGKKN